MYFNGVIMILSIIECILSLTLLGHKFAIVKNQTLFGVKVSAQNPGLVNKIPLRMSAGSTGTI